MKNALFIVLMLFIIALSFTTTSFAAEVLGIEIVDYGIYTAETTKRVGEGITGKGLHVSKSFHFTHRTTKIPATLNLRFGLSYIIKGRPAGETIELKQVILFPISGLKNPKTQKVLHMSERVFSKVIGEKYGAGYKFDEQWEAVPGIWVMQLWHEDRKLAEKTFNVYIP